MPDSATSPNTQAVRLKVDLLPKGPYPDVVILVDVLRATTLTAILFEQGVQTVYISPSLKAARGFAHSQQLLLAGERQGMPPEGFNFGASPAELRRIRFERDIMLTTENGPKAWRWRPWKISWRPAPRPLRSNFAPEARIRATTSPSPAASAEK